MAPAPPDQGRPDPTELTINALQREVAQVHRELGLRADFREQGLDGLKEVLEARINAMDKATQVLHETVTRAPTVIEQAIGHLRELDEEKFRSVEKQFLGRDEAVKAAFAAQEKQALAQQGSNKEAINKSESTTTETIKTNQELGKATTDALTKSLDEVKLSVAQIVAGKQGGKEVVAGMYALAGFLVALILIGGSVAAMGGLR